MDMVTWDDCSVDIPSYLSYNTTIDCMTVYMRV